MKKSNRLTVLTLCVILSLAFGCVTDTASLKVKDSLPQDKLTYYNDAFDQFRTDLWDKAGYIHSEEQAANFSLAKMEIEDGKLKIETETGCFSKGGLASRYTLRGDFDVQVDCHINFLEGTYDMDQALIFQVLETGKEIKTTDVVFIALLKGSKHDSGMVFSAARNDGEFRRGHHRRIGDFEGALRIIRKGSRISTLYKRNSDAEWNRLNTFRCTSEDVMVGFKLKNFFTKRLSITASQPVVATFDNFKINAAEAIIEAEI